MDSHRIKLKTVCIVETPYGFYQKALIGRTANIKCSKMIFCTGNPEEALTFDEERIAKDVAEMTGGKVIRGMMYMEKGKRSIRVSTTFQPGKTKGAQP